MADTYKSIRCPACGNIMQKIFVPSAGVSIDICSDGCGGIFFDNQEINHFKDGSTDNLSEIQKELEGKRFSRPDTNALRVCPACASNMVKTTFGGISNLEIDTCYNCGAIFLDYGELDIIRNHFAHLKRKNTVHNNIVNSRQTEEFSLQQFYREAQREQIENEMLKQNYRRGYNAACSLIDILFRSLTRL